MPLCEICVSMGHKGDRVMGIASYLTSFKKKAAKIKDALSQLGVEIHTNGNDMQRKISTTENNLLQIHSNNSQIIKRIKEWRDTKDNMIVRGIHRLQLKLDRHQKDLDSLVNFMRERQKVPSMESINQLHSSIKTEESDIKKTLAQAADLLKPPSFDS